ncbi:GTP-binding protein [Domibacillus indicus]|uniref:CobW family GTP-binding protein n=1 Tax=Domibacillus indicus TaxID=1437523 RepID=UPI0020415516|nr:GTP-binding protein [Domibacillus indicus]MCM3789318.1 GTP-binding protein [Domibacillus indicus]
MLYRIQDKGCSIKIFDLGGEVHFANVILLNKTDLLNEQCVEELGAVLTKLNPEAQIIKTVFSQVPLTAVLHTKRFDFDQMSQSASWIKELNEEHTPETESLGISSFVYRRRRPFHPERFMSWLENWPEDIIRAKGFFWLASRNDTTGLLSQAGPSIMIQGAGKWVDAYPESEKQALLTEEPGLLQDWDSVYGDRMIEMVLIGVNMKKEEVMASLDACLLSEEEETSEWTQFRDPIPAFSAD